MPLPRLRSPLLTQIPTEDASFRTGRTSFPVRYLREQIGRAESLRPERVEHTDEVANAEAQTVESLAGGVSGCEARTGRTEVQLEFATRSGVTEQYGTARASFSIVDPGNLLQSEKRV
jgi:hypothetical protein